MHSNHLNDRWSESSRDLRMEFRALHRDLRAAIALSVIVSAEVWLVVFKIYSDG